MNLPEIMAIYTGSDGEATKALYDTLNAVGPAGEVATNVFRTCKNSERAKKYRGGGYRGMAYERKDWAIGNLCTILNKHGAALGITWGWGRDPRSVGFEDVLYIDLPTGQISFHNGRRFPNCPDYTKEWDRAIGTAPTRICTWIHQILASNMERKSA